MMDAARDAFLTKMKRYASYHSFLIEGYWSPLPYTLNLAISRRLHSRLHRGSLVFRVLSIHPPWMPPLFQSTASPPFMLCPIP